MDLASEKHVVPLNDFMEQNGDTLFSFHPKLKLGLSNKNLYIPDIHFF
jgi:hypothetical protein